MISKSQDGELQFSIVIQLLIDVSHVWSHDCDTISYTDKVGPICPDARCV